MSAEREGKWSDARTTLRRRMTEAHAHCTCGLLRMIGDEYPQAASAPRRQDCALDYILVFSKRHVLTIRGTVSESKCFIGLIIVTWASQIQFLPRWFWEIATVIADIESHPQFELGHGICFRALDRPSAQSHIGFSALQCAVRLS